MKHIVVLSMFAFLALSWSLMAPSWSARAALSGEFEWAPKGPLEDDRIVVPFAIFFLSDVPDDFRAQAAKLAVSGKQSWRVESRPTPTGSRPSLLVSNSDPQQYPPPDESLLRYFGRDLSKEQIQAVQNPTAVLHLVGFFERPDASENHIELLALTQKLARKWNGLIWDEETRELFSPGAWSSGRLKWQSGKPNLSNHVTMHAYRDGQLFRIITLGMAKFGLPDLVVEDVPSSNSRPVGNLINLVAQTFYERPLLEKKGRIEVSLDRIQNDAARVEQQSNVYDNAKRTAELGLIVAEPDEGDPNNRILQVTFLSDDAQAQVVAQDETLGLLYGRKDEVSYVSHDHPELQAASRRAIAAVMKLKPSFADGPDFNEELLVKAPFATTSGAREWMWIEVVTWTGDKIHGILQNVPFDVPGLKAGARLVIDETEVFDYIHRQPNGTQTGNETAELIRKLRLRKRDL